jgi:SOS-response transcriptional repressor LexA
MTENNYYLDIPIGLRIKEVRQAKGMTQRQFSDSLGIVQGFLSGIERCKKNPSDTLLIALSHLYEINREWLYTGKGEMFSTVPLPDTLIQEFVTTRIPLLKKIPQGFPDCVNEEEICDYVSLPDVPLGCYAIITYGDFMAPTIRDGDMVIFKTGGEVNNKDIILVNNRWGEVILRRYRIVAAEVVFSPDNHAYAPFKPDNTTRIIGTVVGVWRKVKI